MIVRVGGARMLEDRNIKFCGRVSILHSTQGTLSSSLSPMAALSSCSRLAPRALVTGANGSIGRAIVQKLRCVGMHVAGVDLRFDDSNMNPVHNGNHKSCKRTNSTYLPLELDLKAASVRELEQLLEHIESHFSAAVTVLVNCAGITRDARLVKMSDLDFGDVMDVNLRAPWRMTRAFATRLAKAQKEAEACNSVVPGSVINIASIVGKTGNFGQTNYAAAKAGLIGLTKACARELPQTCNTRCNAVLPGFIATPMALAVPEKVLQEKIIPRIPLRELGKPEDVAEVVAFLADCEKSRYVNGASIEVTGGLDM